MSLRSAFNPKSRFLWSLVAVQSVILSLLHHRLNFWGWPWDKQLLIMLVLAPAVAFVLERLLRPIWPSVITISIRRWILFLIPALAISAVAAWQILTPPEVQHGLEISPAGIVDLREVRAAYGNTVPLPTFGSVPGWTMQDGALVSTIGASPIEYSFQGPVGEPARLSFRSAPQAGRVSVTLDGRTVRLELAGPDGGERRVRLDTTYRWGAFNFLIIPVVLAADVFAFLALLSSLWLVQELAQQLPNDDAETRPEGFLSHAQALAVVCSLAFLLHALNFLAVPLAVLKDSPSYLRGAVYWIQHHSLDGVSSYRGLGTTLLFAPVMSLFGRNPLAVKALLHILALGCVPLSYRIGWQLGRRRWFAFAAALLTALIPDLYAYSSLVLSEAPQAFFGLLFCSLLLSALDTPSFGWILSMLLAGSFATMVRSEDAALLILGAAFLLLRLLSDRRALAEAEPRQCVPYWQVLLAFMLAVLPLLGWAAHNQRVYGFFGLSDYGGAALYDGWVYFGENSPVTITDHNSAAVRRIESVHSIGKPANGDAPTSWTIYFALLARGYTSEQAFGLLQKAALDSIRKDPALTTRLLAFKLRQAFEPHPFIPATFPLAGGQMSANTLQASYFDQERAYLPAAVSLQRFMNGLIVRWYGTVFNVWLRLGLLMLFICLYRRPFFHWFVLGALAINNVLLPSAIGMAMWRYVFLGLLLMPYALLAGAQSAGSFASLYVGACRSRSPASASSPASL